MSQVSLSEEDGLDSETINEEEDDCDDEEDMQIKGGELKWCKEFHHQVLYQCIISYWKNANMATAQNVSAGVWLGSNAQYQNVIQQSWISS